MEKNCKAKNFQMDLDLTVMTLGQERMIRKLEDGVKSILKQKSLIPFHRLDMLITIPSCLLTREVNGLCRFGCGGMYFPTITIWLPAVLSGRWLGRMALAEMLLSK